MKKILCIVGIITLFLGIGSVYAYTRTMRNVDGLIFFKNNNSYNNNYQQGHCRYGVPDCNQRGYHTHESMAQQGYHHGRQHMNHHH